MSKFEDHLWTEFVREHGDAMARLNRSTVRHAHRGPRLVAGTGLGLVGIGVALVLVLGATRTSPAFAVTPNHDGTVTISIKRLSGIAGANAKLHQLGIRAQVVPQAPVGCQPTLDSTGGQGAPAPSHEMQETASAHWTINPRQVPADSTLALTPPPTPPAGTPQHRQQRLGRPGLELWNGRSWRRQRPSAFSPIGQQRQQRCEHQRLIRGGLTNAT